MFSLGILLPCPWKARYSAKRGMGGGGGVGQFAGRDCRRKWRFSLKKKKH